MKAPKVVHTAQMEWTPSPSPSVWRKRIEHDGPPEAGRVTSVVRYDAGSRFRAHPHPDGEEILVLQGVFSDERGDHPAGTYLLNPEGYEHAPYSESGCVLFVKLKQYPGRPRAQVRLDTSQGWSEHKRPGVTIRRLYAEPDHPESMHLLRMAAGVDLGEIELSHDEEMFVVEGEFEDEHGAYQAGSWICHRAGSSHRPRTVTGCTLYVKKIRAR